MNFMLAATIASSLLIIGKSTNSDKRRGHQRSTKDKILNPSTILNTVKPKKITVRKSSDPSHKSSFHFVVETFENDKDRSKKKGSAKSGDYQANNPWLDKCSLKMLLANMVQDRTALLKERRNTSVLPAESDTPCNKPFWTPRLKISS